MIGPVVAIALKDLRLLLRDKPGLFFTFVFPVMIGVFFGTIFSGGGDSGPKALRVAVVDEDASEGSRGFVAEMKSSGHFDPVSVGTRQEGLDAVRRGAFPAVVMVPKGFGAQEGNLFAGRATTLEVGADPSRAAESGMIRGLLTELAFKRMSSAFSDTEKMRSLAGAAKLQARAAAVLTPKDAGAVDTFYDSLVSMFDAMDRLPAMREETKVEGAVGEKPAAAGVAFAPVTIKDVSVQREERAGPKNAYAVTFAQAIMWGVVGCCSGFAVSLLNERNSGTLVRLRLTPMGWGRVLAGKSLACLMTTLLMAAVMILLAVLAFKVRPVSWAMLVIGMGCVAACFVGVMMLLAVIGRKTGSGQIGWSILLVLTMVGGGSIPLFVMPGWLQRASGISPVKWGVLALEGGLWRGSTAGEMLLPCAILVGVGAAAFWVGAWLFSREEVG